MNRSLRNLAFLGLLALGASTAAAQNNVLFNLQYTPSSRQLVITPTGASANTAVQAPTYAPAFAPEYGLLFNGLFLNNVPNNILVGNFQLPTDSISGTGIIATSISGSSSAALMQSVFPDSFDPKDLSLQSTSMGSTMTFGTGAAFQSNKALTITFSSSLGNATYMPTSAFTGGLVSAFTTGGVEQTIGAYSYSVVPEPSTYAAIAGALGLAYAVYRRRRQAAAASASA